MTDRLRIGIIGCGRVAFHHARFITRSRDARLAAVVDPDAGKAEAFARRWGAPAVFAGLDGLLDAVVVDVVHVLTPPSLHYAQAAAALDAGAHVLLEKPLAFTVAELDDLYRRAAAARVTLCPDFIQLFTPLMRRAIALVRTGAMGPVRHVESHLSVDLAIPEVREARGLHWSLTLPGGVLHNYLTHPLYLALFWLGELRDVQVDARALGILPQGLTDHLSIGLVGERVTGHVVCSTGTGPGLFETRVICERGMVHANLTTATLTVAARTPLPWAADRASFPFRTAGRQAWEGTRNIVDFVRGRLLPYQGLEGLFTEYYAALRAGREAPVGAVLARAVVHAEELVFPRAGKLHFALADAPSRQNGVRCRERVLVTGATGYVGRAVVEHLVGRGYAVRVLVRPTSRVDGLDPLGVERVVGDVRDPGDVRRAVQGVHVVVHLAAGLAGSEAFMLESSRDGTRNVAQAAAACGVEHVLHVSSLAVYDYDRIRKGGRITEESPLEPDPPRRGGASRAKREAEDVALAAMRAGAPAPHWTILRPSYVLGRGRDLANALGTRKGNLVLALGGPRRHLRLIHVDDVAGAIVACIGRPVTRGKVYVLSDPDSVTAREFARRVLRSAAPQVRVLWLRRWFVGSAVFGLRILLRLTGRRLGMNRARLNYLFKDATAGMETFTTDTGWRPSRPLADRLIWEAQGT